MLISFTTFWIMLLTNNDRLRYNLPKLQENHLLDIAAQHHAEDMEKGHYFAHSTPSGSPTWTYFMDTGYSYNKAGENLAKDFKDPLTEEQAWMNSPGHRDNILNPDFTEIGIGIEQPYVVVTFAEP
jgi:uncharacterized protein YkwD